MLPKSFKFDQILLYRLVILLGAPIILLDNYFIPDLADAYSEIEVVTRYLAVSAAVISLGMSFVSAWWRHHLGEFTLVLGYLVIANAAAVVHGSGIATYESYYAVAALVIISMVFHRTALVLLYVVPSLTLMVVVSFMVPEPQLSPLLYGIVLGVFSAYAAFFSICFIHIRSQRDQSQAISNLWFDEAADALLYGETADPTPTRVNPKAHDLLGSTDNHICGELIRKAFFLHCKDEDPVKAYKNIMRQGEWNETVKIPTAKGDWFWGNLAMRRVLIEDKDVTLIRVADVSAEVESRQAMQAAMKAAEDAAQTRSRFLANMSHEIRTPMNGVIGMTSLMLDTDLNPEQRSYMETTCASGESLLSIINEILDFSKIDADQIELEQQQFDLETCCIEALDMVSTAAASKQIDLLLQYQLPLGQKFTGDVTRLRQILSNLLSNAVKFTDEGEVLLQVRESGAEAIHITVTDTGIGIPREKLEKLFEPFTQADASTTRRFGGTGLGLTICKGLIEKMEGRIEVSSEVDVGSRFEFWIPLPVAIPGSEPEALEVQGRSALVVCANESGQQIIAELLQRVGVAASAVASADAVNKAMQYDLVVIDAKNCDEEAVLASLASSEGSRTIRLHDINSRRSSLPYMVSLRKPLRPTEFLGTVRETFATPVQEMADVRQKENYGDLPVHGKSFLLAEDNIINQKVAVEMLKKMGVRLDVVANGKEALEVFKQRNYDYVFMDVQMPELDGIEATQRIRELDAIDQPYIIAMTANAMLADREDCLRAGMDDFVSKPLSMEKLYGVLRSAIAQTSVGNSRV